MRCLDGEPAVFEPDLSVAAGWTAQGPEDAARILAHGVHSLICVPLLARGVLLGIASFYRSLDPSPFGEDDLRLARELVARAALSVDNARCFTREHTLALALQRSLMPRGLPEQGAVEVAHRYLPPNRGWAATGSTSSRSRAPGSPPRRGRRGPRSARRRHHGPLRMAARNFAELELAPDELLTHLDNLLVRLDREEGDEGAAGSGAIAGATCLYAIYDPTSQLCTMARAGHPPPALVAPDGSVTFPDLPAGPPLGLGGLPFETAEIHLPEHSTLVLYTDGLVDRRHRDIDTSLERLRGALAHPDRRPEDTCRAVIEAVAPAIPPTTSRCSSPGPYRAGRPDRHLGPARGPGPGLRHPRRRHPPAGRMGARRARVRRRADAQRAGHQRGPLRLGARTGEAHPRPDPHLRGLRRQQHRPAPAAGGLDGRGRARPVPRRAAVPGLGRPLHPPRQGHLAECALDAA